MIRKKEGVTLLLIAIISLLYLSGLPVHRDNAQTTRPLYPVFISGTTDSIGGYMLEVGKCATGKAFVAGATVGMPFKISRLDGTFIGGGYTLNATVITDGIVTVNLCAVVAGTPPSKIYFVSQ